MAGISSSSAKKGQGLKRGEIISASRRTDIPAFHYDWLQKVLREGRVLVPNPRFKDRVRTVDLCPDSVHSIVLWSKDFGKVLRDPGLLRDYNLYFQYTITGYSRRLEPFAPRYEEALRTLDGLLKQYRPEQFNIRFDPILVSLRGEDFPTPDDPAKARINMFRRLCRDLAGLGMKNAKITISYITLYPFVAQRLAACGIDLRPLPPAGQRLLAEEMAAVAAEFGLNNLYSCACPAIETATGLKQGGCIDGALLTALFGGRVSLARDTGQRGACRCTRSIDIGSYALRCGFSCNYCYGRFFGHRPPAADGT